MTSYIGKKSLIFDRKLRIKFKSYEKKKKIYSFISKEVGKEVLIFLKKKNLVTLNFSLEDQLFLKECQFFSLTPKVPERAGGQWNRIGRWPPSLRKASKLFLLNPGNPSLSEGVEFAMGSKTTKNIEENTNTFARGSEANIFYYMIFNQFNRVFKKLEKKRLFFITRKLPTSVKIKNYCLLTSNSRAVYRKIKLGRQSLKRQISLGFLPGFTKASF
jgi:ribosomal protein S14